jgi:hypothetical protein
MVGVSHRLEVGRSSTDYWKAGEAGRCDGGYKGPAQVVAGRPDNRY